MRERQWTNRILHIQWKCSRTATSRFRRFNRVLNAAAVITRKTRGEYSLSYTIVRYHYYISGLYNDEPMYTTYLVTNGREEEIDPKPIVGHLANSHGTRWKWDATFSCSHSLLHYPYASSFHPYDDARNKYRRDPSSWRKTKKTKDHLADRTI